MMKIVIAPDAFKESLSSLEVANAIQQGFCLAIHDAEYVKCPMADGGTGTLAVLSHVLPIILQKVNVTGPLFEQRETHYGILEEKTQLDTMSDMSGSTINNEKIAIIEMAEASGLHLVPLQKRNPLQTTTLGTGEMILHALEKGCRKFILGLGGSATCDGGMGALTALGVQFKDDKHQMLEPKGENLSKIAVIDTHGLNPDLAHCEIILAHDVENPFLGLEGALMYAPQKGAHASDIENLHIGFEHYALQIQSIIQKNLGLPGLGAAGGLAMGLYAFLNARLTPGAPLFMNMLQLTEKMKNADLVITGEGQLDAQTLYGKTPLAVAKLAKTMNIPVIAFAACLQGDMHELFKQGIDAAFSIAPGPIPKQMCIEKAKVFLMQSAYNAARLIKLSTHWKATKKIKEGGT